MRRAGPRAARAAWYTYPCAMARASRWFRPALALVAGCAPSADPAPAPRCAPVPASADVLTFHGDARRTGWNARETALTPERVASGAFGPRWSSPPLDDATLGGVVHPPHVYATPLYADDVRLTAGPWAGRVASVVVVATSNAWAYAVSALPTRCEGAALAPGTVLWRARLGTPAVTEADGGVPMGVLSTPVIDRAADPPRVYVASMDATAGWQVWALALSSGQALPGWPVALDAAAVGAVNGNGPALFPPAHRAAQRGALALAPGGDRLYVSFGTYRFAGPGWMVAVDTRRPRVAAAFAGAPSLEATSNAGMWGSGGPALDAAGDVYMTTGNGPEASGRAPGAWGNSLLRWSPELRLGGTYTPYNYCVFDRENMDLGGCSPLVLPDLDPALTATPRLVVFGSKQGTAYLVDRDRLPGALDRRPACGADPTLDRSLLPPAPQPHSGARGPLHVFPVYTERHAQLDHARMRTTPAYFRDASGAHFVFLAGSSRPTEEETRPVPPALARLRVVLAPGAPAHLAIDRVETATTLVNPGSPVVTSDGPRHGLVWVLDSNQPRSAPLVGPGVARPVLYAFDAETLALRWRSAPDALAPGGKYGSPTVAHGVVFVGTDRVQAFGLAP